MFLMCFHLVVVGNGALTSEDFFVPQCSMRLMFFSNIKGNIFSALCWQELKIDRYVLL